MNVLVACEESQEVCKAFRARGHRAFSCDIQDCSGGHPEWHIKGDVLPILNGNCTFTTANGHTHTIGALGFDYRPSALYRHCRKRGTMVSGKAKRFSATESVCVLRANGACRLRKDRRRKSYWHHVQRIPETRSNYTAVAVRAWRDKSDLSVAKRAAAAATDRDCGWAGSEGVEDAAWTRTGEAQVKDIPRHSPRYGRTVGVGGYTMSGIYIHGMEMPTRCIACQMNYDSCACILMFGSDHWLCAIEAFDLREVLSNNAAKKKHHGFI